MGRLRVLSGRDVCRILASHGFVEARRRGSHVVVQKVEAGRTVTVPIPDHSELRIGTCSRSFANPALPVPSSNEVPETTLPPEEIRSIRGVSDLNSGR